MKLAECPQHIVLQSQPRLDLQGGNALKEQVLAISAEHSRLWVIDLAAVEFIDSSGLGALVTALKSARRQGSRLVLCHPSATVKLILEITQLDRVFEVFDELEAVFSTDSELLSA
ncbi:STAS domain-containing protein [Lyngbya sp. PCC 8106]|uniref:STAS domain-containing protein n=1 Tax=Lyngbya sp. (strain PCC 8106) TaxID=313612 RepID=UPI0000EAA440|nr:STAS domain-containing protein [Lyngbya sp. PCC 8106]EAW34426.1 Anti-Sigma-factor antagonist (STAS) domain protein [Lyngbya sp. PCC 8106]